MGASDLQIQVWQRKLPCVIEPALVLGQACGPALALGLARGFEAWLTRSFWQVLDASELLARPRAAAPEQLMPDGRALSGWIALRDGTDASAWTLRWMGDCMADSQLREAAAPDLVERYERLLAVLLERLDRARRRTWADQLGAGWQAGLDRGLAAADALALSACLDGALVLCGAAGDELPMPVSTLEQVAVPVARFDGGDAGNLLAAERELVRQALAAAGLAALSQTLPRLAAVHVLCEAAASDDDSADADAWTGARAWWYWV